MGYDKEVAMIAQARAMDLLTCPYVHNADEARAMAEAGADILVPHVGLTTKGMIGAKSAIDLGDGARNGSRRWPTPRSSVRDDVLVLCHGGPIAEPADVAEVFRNDPGHRRLLRRQQHRAAPDRAGDRRPGPGLRRLEAPDGATLKRKESDDR